MSRKNQKPVAKGYYASSYSKEYGGRRSSAPRRSKKRSSHGREVLIIVLAFLVLAAAVFGLVKLIRHHQEKAGAGLKTASVAVSETELANVGTARVLTDQEKEMLRNSEKYKNIMAHKADYPPYLIDDLQMNPEILDFMGDYLTTEPVGHGGLTAAEKKASHPLFVQWDKRWGYSKYGEDAMAISGCGPTALAMVAYSLTRNDQIDPFNVAQFAMQSGYYVTGVGTAWSLMSEGAKHYGLDVTSQTKYTEVQLKDALEKGGMVILSVGKGDFTVHKGHFIVLYGYKNGKFQLNDPFSYTNSSKLWSYDRLMNQAKNTWILFRSGSNAAASAFSTTVAPTTAPVTVPTTASTYRSTTTYRATSSDTTRTTTVYTTAQTTSLG